ncbi:MAG: glycoside hydrolase family 78 protein [Spirochaetaceae bacterium]|jgi:alpha-L-rhamnosidase|nr:glycoside hydrolase family 78 protein [Spirochaetaceae bacterium]
MITVRDIRVEYRTNPVDVATGTPRFSWKIESGGRGVTQSAYALELASDGTFGSPLWQSGKVQSRESHLVRYGAASGALPLESSKKYFWRVKIWDNQETESPWSETAFFETTLLTSGEWKAVFISAEGKDAGASSAGALLRKEFVLSAGIKSARLYASAKGLYRAVVNGRRAGDGVLSPGWTEYNRRILFQTYEVTDLMAPGVNVLGLMVGPGWYKGDLAGWVGKRNVFGKQTAVIAQLRVEYEDGKVEIIPTDASWQGSLGPVLYSEIYHGETYDARLEQPGWDQPHSAAAGWKPVTVESADTGILRPQDGPLVKEQEVLKPRFFFTTPRGERVIDFGQNISGWVRFKVQGSAGDRVTIRHAETLDAAGNFYTENLRSARQTIQYTLKGGEVETYSPLFTFQGFRYIAVDEYPGVVDKDNFEAVAIYSDMRSAGEFSCSYPKLNQFISNVRWSMKDNFVDIPTDCPQRDERLGWTGDAEIFCRAAAYFMETAPFFKKWLRDLALSQLPDGQVPHVVPDVLKETIGKDDKITQEAGACAWADAAVIIPWNIYTYFGDREILEEQYPSMKKWVEYIRGVAQDGLLFNTGFHFGDWVALDAKEGSYFGATPNDLTATAFYAYSAFLLSQAASVLGKGEDAACYRKLREDIGEAYGKEFFTPSGRLAVRTQTAHILSLAFDLVPELYKRRTVDTLVALIAEQRNHLTTGFVGTPFVCQVLADNGHADLAYELLLKEDFPSWLYQVTKGATTVWEHWDGLKPDGTMWSPDMNSFNHYAYGAVSDWVFSALGGLDTDREKPAFARSILRPCPGGGITWAETSYESVYGRVALRWEIREGSFYLTTTVPVNTEAELTLPGAEPGTIGDVAFAPAKGGAVAVLGSGSYAFEYPWEG